MTKLSSAAYVNFDGTACPNCGSEQIRGEGVEIDGDGAFQAISCEECYATWTDVYQLIGYSNLVLDESGKK